MEETGSFQLEILLMSEIIEGKNGNSNKYRTVYAVTYLRRMAAKYQVDLKVIIYPEQLGEKLL